MPSTWPDSATCPRRPSIPKSCCSTIQDHLGGSNIITDGSGNLVQHVQYSPYGEIEYELYLSVSVNYLFTGQEFDREAGLYYYNARYYDPEIGRFIQPDTIIPDPSDNQAYNRYSYCRNNPIMLTDPSGHEFRGTPVAGQSVNEDEINAQLGALGVQNPADLNFGTTTETEVWRRHLLRDYLMTGNLHPDGQAEMESWGLDSPDQYFNSIQQQVAEREQESLNNIGAVWHTIGAVVGAVVGYFCYPAAPAAYAIVANGGYYLQTGDESLSGLSNTRDPESQDPYIVAGGEFGCESSYHSNILADSGNGFNLNNMYASNLPGDTMSTDTG